jgi:hypothetical protein
MTKNNGTTQVAVFEEIRKNTDIVAKDELKVPMSMVFGHGTVGDVASFGGNTLLENTKEVDAALQNVGELQNIWNHSHSQWDWKHLNLHYHSPYKNMRQLSAEIARKKSALNEAKWRHIKAEVKVKKLEEKLTDPNIEYWDEVDTKIKLAQKKEQLAEGIITIEGAMKDVLALNELYEQLKSKVNSFSEEDFEKEETKNHLKRSLVQSIRDVRMTGAITKGEQEYLEQIGVNPSKVQNLLRDYVAKESEQESWDVSELYEFVDRLTNELTEVHKVDQKRMELQGFSHESNPNLSYINTLAIPHKNT